MNVKRCTPEIKIRLLVENYAELIVADRERKNNRTGTQEICRIKNSFTQSFSMLDAPQFAVGRQIYYDFGDMFRSLNVKMEVGNASKEEEQKQDDRSKSGAVAFDID